MTAGIAAVLAVLAAAADNGGAQAGHIDTRAARHRPSARPRHCGEWGRGEREARDGGEKRLKGSAARADALLGV